MVPLNIREIKQRVVSLKMQGFSLVEVLVSLAIVSFAILYLLVSAANATRRATLNKLQIQMSNAASGILEQTKATLYTIQQDEDWVALLTQPALIIDPNTQKVVATSTCFFDDEILNSNCPSVNTITTEQYNFIGYVMKPEQVESNLYKITIKVACKDTGGQKCPQGLKPVVMETYVSKY